MHIQIILMLNKIKTKLKKNTEIFALCILVFITILSTSYYNFNKKKTYQIIKAQLITFILKKL